jgi:hypothetical protein
MINSLTLASSGQQCIAYTPTSPPLIDLKPLLLFSYEKQKRFLPEKQISTSYFHPMNNFHMINKSIVLDHFTRQRENLCDGGS